MKPVVLRDKTTIEAYCHGNTDLHIYSLGDLDDFFWPDTTWYAPAGDGMPEVIALLYSCQRLPSLLALTDDRPDVMRELLTSLIPVLPRRFYTHFSPGLESVFSRTHEIEFFGQHDKMSLRDRGAPMKIGCSRVTRLTVSDADDARRLYRASYPDNWFEARMLETGQYFGIRQEGELVSIAGVHVCSETYRVAALGNITTHPQHRGRGYGSAVTARVCRSLFDTTDHIGLNVKSDNEAAISCYKKLGFETVSRYNEFMIERRAKADLVMERKPGGNNV